MPLSARQPRTENGSSSDLTPHVLVIDDEEIICQQLELLYSATGFRVTTVSRGEEALQYLEDENIDLVVTDIRLPGFSGIDLTRKIQSQWPDVPVIVMTGHADIQSAVEALKLGASDYIAKPFSAAAMQDSSRAILEQSKIFTQIRHLRQTLKDSCKFGGMLSRTPEMHQVFELIQAVSGTDMTVVIEGETGTGKELVASAIHYQSSRRGGPFSSINCAGFPETLLESELFGHEKGAFTSADQSRTGKFELTNTGTLFLDEIESISLTMQAKLLRVLQERKIQRLGGSRTIPVDIRVIAATNVPLEGLVAEGSIRSDFYFRINVVPIRLRPLRQRLDDIPLLVQDFLHNHPIPKRKGISRVSQRAMSQMMAYNWPGNIRELHNVIEKAIVLARSRVIEQVDLADRLPLAHASKGQVLSTPPLAQWIKEQEKTYLTQKLKLFGGRIDLTAKSCGVDVRTLHRKMRQYGLDKKIFSQSALKPLRGSETP